MKLVRFPLVLFCLATPCLAQEQDEVLEQVTPIANGAIYEEKTGVDGAAAADTYMMTHVVCSKGNPVVRVMLPIGPDDDGSVSDSDGPASTLTQTPDGFDLSFTAYGKTVVKPVVLKPTNDSHSIYSEQFTLQLTVGEPLWKALRDPQGNKAVALLGTGGRSLSLPAGKTFDRFLKLCGL